MAENTSDQRLQELLDASRRDVERWTYRNQRFQLDQELYEMWKTNTSRWARNTDDLIILNDPKVLVSKVSRILARMPNIIEIAPSEPELRGVAQRMENYCYTCDIAENQRWMTGLNNPYRYDQAFYLVLRGWVVSRTSLNPDSANADYVNDPSAMFDHQLVDPAHVYPTIAGDRPIRITHKYETSSEELLADPLITNDAKRKIIRDLEDQLKRQAVKIRGIYWLDTSGSRGSDKASWWHCVIVNESDFLKPPTELGYNPWTIATAQGSSYRATDWDNMLYTQEVGIGLLDSLRDNQKHMNKLATKLSVLMSLEANPPVTIYSQDGAGMRVSFEPGSRNYLQREDKLEAHRTGPNLGDFELLWKILETRESRGSLPPGFFAEFSDRGSGFRNAVAMNAGKDVLYPYIEALNGMDALIYRKKFELYRDHGPSKKLKTRTYPDENGVMRVEDISAGDIKNQGVYVEVTRNDMSPMELIQRANMAMALVREQLISRESARGREWIGTRNPNAENMRILSEQVYLNPKLIEVLTPFALEATGQRGLAEIYRTLQTAVPPAGAVPPGGAPPAALGAETLAPIMQAGNPAGMMVNNQLPPDMQAMNAVMALLTGGASGGAGGGGMPPIPGSTSPVAPFTPPGVNY